jgi:hypothetical protein
MQPIEIAATKTTPHIVFDSERGALRISGESYPENTADFYAPLFAWLDACAPEFSTTPTAFEIDLLYFNSSSSKILMNLFGRLQGIARAGGCVSVKWIYAPGNDNALEYGEEFQEDITDMPFTLEQKAG